MSVRVFIATQVPAHEGHDEVWQWREKQYVAAGIEDFVAFRLALVPNIDWHQVVRAKQNGASDERLLQLYLE